MNFFLRSLVTVVVKNVAKAVGNIATKEGGKKLAQQAGKCAVKVAGNALGAGVFPIGDIVVELCEAYFKQKDERQLREEVQSVAQDVKASQETLEKLLRQQAGDLPEELHQAIGLYLKQVPRHLQHSLRSAADPSGRTVPVGMSLRSAGDLRRLLPDRLPQFRPGERLEGTDLRLVEFLAMGGYGEVWLATHESRKGSLLVVLKFCADPAAAPALKNELRLLDQIESEQLEGFVNVKNANLEATPPYVEYEYVPGGDLASYVYELHHDGKASWRNVANLVLRLAKNVGRIHRMTPKAIIHRDLKPDNILVQRVKGKAGVKLKIADLGIGATVAAQEIKDWQQTRANSQNNTALTACTPLWASRQQRNGDVPTPQDDVYALGVIWYQMMIGDFLREPPRGAGWKEELTAREMPPKVVGLIERCIDDNPAKRPADAQQLAELIEKALAPVPNPNPKVKASRAPAVAAVCVGILFLLVVVFGQYTYIFVADKKEREKLAQEERQAQLRFVGTWELENSAGKTVLEIRDGPTRGYGEPYDGDFSYRDGDREVKGRYRLHWRALQRRTSAF